MASDDVGDPIEMKEGKLVCVAGPSDRVGDLV